MLPNVGAYQAAPTQPNIPWGAMRLRGAAAHANILILVFANATRIVVRFGHFAPN